MMSAALVAQIVDDRALAVGVHMLERVGSRLIIERRDDPGGVL